jgi:hypothetical protein
LILEPDTTSGGSYRQNQHADRIIMPPISNGTSQGDKRDPKIDLRPP